MPLTSAQRSQIRKILATFRRDVGSIVKKHKRKVFATIESSDADRSEQIKRQIQSL